MTDLDASYCPVCGNILATAQAIHADDGEPFSPEACGEFEQAGAHAVVRPQEVRVYVHGDTEEIATDGGTITADPDPPALPQVIADVLDDATGGVDRQILIKRVAEISGATIEEVEEALGGEIRHGRAIVVDGEIRKTPNRRFAGGGRR